MIIPESPVFGPQEADPTHRDPLEGVSLWALKGHHGPVYFTWAGSGIMTLENGRQFNFVALRQLGDRMLFGFTSERFHGGEFTPVESADDHLKGQRLPTHGDPG